jgi:hypothetical protein
LIDKTLPEASASGDQLFVTHGQRGYLVVQRIQRLLFLLQGIGVPLAFVLHLLTLV